MIRLLQAKFRQDDERRVDSLGPVAFVAWSQGVVLGRGDIHWRTDRRV